MGLATRPSILVAWVAVAKPSDITYQVTDASGTTVLDKKDTIRTNFYSQCAGSTETLAQPIAQKVAERIKDARLR
jgi:hypothetical protein